MIKIDIFDKINNKLIVSFIKQILHRCRICRTTDKTNRVSWTDHMSMTNEELLLSAGVGTYRTL